MKFTETAITDEKLPTLAGVLATYPNAEIVKYSPEKRCTVRIVREGQTYFAKVYPPKFLRRRRGERIDEIGKTLWSLAQSGELNFRVPRPAGWDTATHTVWSEQLTGAAAVDKLKAGEGDQLVYRIGQAVALIASSTIIPNRTFDYSEQLTDAAEFSEITVQKFPGLNSTVRSLLESFERVDLPDRKLMPIHGDMHIDQWLARGEELGLLDFEDFSLGHPERDLAFFMVQLEAEYGRKLDHKLLNAHFLQGYRSEGMDPNEELINVYSAHKWFSKASKAGSFSEASGLISRAVNCLENLHKYRPKAARSRRVAEATVFSGTM